MATRDQDTSEERHVEPVDTGSPEHTIAASDNGAAPEAPGQEQELTLEGLQEQLAQQRQKTEEYVDHLQRLQAEFQNYRRRMMQEKSEAVSTGTRARKTSSLPRLTASD